MNLAYSLASKKEKLATMNKGASFLVQPHNLTFSKNAANAVEGNHRRVIGDLQSILDKHEAAEAKKIKGLSLEMAAQKKSKKPAPILRTEALLEKINKNYAGQQVNGRAIIQADEGLYKKIKKSMSPQAGLAAFGSMTSKNGKPVALGEEE